MPGTARNRSQGLRRVAFTMASLAVSGYGLVGQLLVDAGDSVEQGSVLLRLDTALIERELTLARAATEEARAAAEEATRLVDEASRPARSVCRTALAMRRSTAASSHWCR